MGDALNVFVCKEVLCLCYSIYFFEYNLVSRYSAWLLLLKCKNYMWKLSWNFFNSSGKSKGIWFSQIWEPWLSCKSEMSSIMKCSDESRSFSFMLESWFSPPVLHLAVIRSLLVCFRPVAGYVNLCPHSISTQPHDIHQMHSTIKHEILHALVSITCNCWSSHDSWCLWLLPYDWMVYRDNRA